jgi:hypothetical protein
MHPHYIPATLHAGAHAHCRSVTRVTSVYTCIKYKEALGPLLRQFQKQNQNPPPPVTPLDNTRDRQLSFRSHMLIDCYWLLAHRRCPSNRGR